MKQGFTLIELLVVVLIIGILSSIALPQYQTAVEKARLTEALTNINAMEKSVQIWDLSNPGENMDSPKDQMDISLSGCVWDSPDSCESKYFVYAVLDGRDDYDKAMRMKADGDSMYNLYYGNWKGDGSFVKACAPEDGSRTAIAICKSLESQGFIYGYP